MKPVTHIALLLFLAFSEQLFSQSHAFKENGKWGIKENETIEITPVYDTIFGFDSTAKVCLACFKIRTASASKFIKMMNTVYSCNYLNKKNERLFIRTEKNDTCSVFSLSKSSLHYLRNQSLFTVAIKTKKYLLDKNFKQYTYTGYYDISLSDEKEFYVTQILNEWDMVVTGVINTQEREIIPYKYSHIKVNPSDSLIIACSAGIGNSSEDDVYTYDGKKKESSRRHIDMATKHFLIHKIFEPKEYYIIYNIATKEEKQLIADEVKFFMNDEILLRQKNDWYLYDLNTHQKKPYKPS